MPPAQGPRLFLVCGLPGAGKTTTARALAASRNAVRLCPDEWMNALGIDLFDEPFRALLEVRLWQTAQDILAAGGRAILEEGFWTRASRDEKRLAARALGASVELVYLDVPLEELLRRVTERQAQSPTDNVVITRDHLSGWDCSFQKPTSAEVALFDPPERPTASTVWTQPRQ